MGNPERRPFDAPSALHRSLDNRLEEHGNEKYLGPPDMNPAIRFRGTSKNLLGVATIALFLLFIVMLPRYTETAKIWYLLLILTGFFYLVFDFRQIGNITAAERTFFTVMLLNFAWMALSLFLSVMLALWQAKISPQRQGQMPAGER